MVEEKFYEEFEAKRNEVTLELSDVRDNVFHLFFFLRCFVLFEVVFHV